MEKSKNNNWLLIGALVFFLVSAGFTTTTNVNQQVSSNGGLCWVCGALGCTFQAGTQYGRTMCLDGNPCFLIGDLCGGPDDGGGPIE